MIMSSAVDRWWSVSELSESMLADRSVPVKQCDMISESVVTIRESRQIGIYNTAH